MNLTVHSLLIGCGFMPNKNYSKEMVLEAFEKEKKQRDHSITSGTIFTDILNLLIEEERKKAFHFALFISQSGNLPLFSRLFAELADSIQREDEDKIQKTIVKLFYYII
jgi:hypothetical protein